MFSKGDDRMIWILELLSGFYWVLLPQFVIENLLRTRWRQSYTKEGINTILKDGFTSALGFYSVPLYVPIDGYWNGHAIKRLLRSHNITIWGWGFAFGQFYFHVHKDDAWEAQDVLLRAGVELLG
jgi:hypothetical protein